jgi:hypothetical protein
LADAVTSDPVLIECHGWTRLGHLKLTRKRGHPRFSDPAPALDRAMARADRKVTIIADAGCDLETFGFGI